MNRKHHAGFVLLTASALVLSGCATSSDKSTSEDEKVYTVKVGYENNPGEPIDKAAHKWKELVEKQSDERIKMELYPSSQLGSKTDITEQMRSGANVMTLTDGSFLSDFVPDAGITAAPYLADDVDSMFKLFDSDWFSGIEDELQEENIHVVTTNWLYGARQVVADKPATTPGEFQGMKIRAPANKMFTETINAMGATATPMSLGEVYSSISQGVIDGMENPLTVIYGSKVYEEAKHVMLTDHMIMVATWVAGEQFIESLPDDLADTLATTGDQAGDFMTETVQSSEKEIKKDLQQKGVTFHEVDKEAFKKAVEPVYDEFPEWSPGLHEKVDAIIDGD